MTEFLKDYSDYVVLIPSLVIGALISYWFFTKQRQLKSIYYEVLNNYNIVEVDKSYQCE